MQTTTNFSELVTIYLDMLHRILPSCIPIRWEVAILIFFGLVANYSLRLNLSIAIVEMSNSTSADGTDITWSSEEKNYVLSAFFYGYVYFYSCVAG